jgi:single-stranded DNA-specific DHH superfamily exonuclease
MRALEWIKESYRTALVFHIDTDGCCSGALVAKLFERLEKKIDFYIGSIPTLPDRVMRKLTHGMYNLIIFVDLSVDQQADKIRELAKDSKILIMDHHTISENLNSSQIIHMNPKLDGIDKYYPASKYIYDLFKLEKYNWIATMGVIGDSGVPQWGEFVDDTFRKHGWERGENKNARGTILAKADEMVGSARMLYGNVGAEKAFEILATSDNLDEFFEKGDELERWHKRVQGEIKKKLDEFEKTSEKRGHVRLFELESDLNLGSALSTILSNQYPNKTIMIYDRKNTMIKFHLRRGDGKIDLSEAVKNSIRSFDHSAGGGHKNAAGGHVVESDWTRFKKVFFKEIGV